jgi:hypothetical protein
MPDAVNANQLFRAALARGSLPTFETWIKEPPEPQGGVFMLSIIFLSALAFVVLFIEVSRTSGSGGCRMAVSDVSQSAGIAR